MSKLNILAELRKLRELKELAATQRGELSISQLEQEFLRLAELCKPSSLEVKNPSLYPLPGIEQVHVREALKSRGIESNPDFIDATGDFPEAPDDLMIIVSPTQVESEFLDEKREFLLPLLQNVFIEGYDLISGFGIHEALVGNIKLTRDGLNLREAHIFPRRFTRGPYNLSVTLDSPHHTVQRYTTLTDNLEKLVKEPKKRVLDPAFFTRISKESFALRERLGLLSRYSVPSGNSYEAVSNSVYLENCSDLFYLYVPEKNQNYVVHFGKNPFNIIPSELHVIDGRDGEVALSTLLRAGVYDVSSDILDSRIESMEKVQEEATRKSQTALGAAQFQYNKLLRSLKDASREVKNLRNTEIRRDWAARLDPAVLEFMLYPTTDDPIARQLIPRLSWDPVIREYHDTKGFKDKFLNSKDDLRVELVQDIVQHMRFANHQNNMVNRWLYQEHRELCESSGIIFSVK